MLSLKARTGWARVTVDYTIQTLTPFLYAQLADPRTVLYVWDDGTGVQAFCGGALSSLYLPPHDPTVFEWGWFGPAKQAVACWHAVQAWGRVMGAKWAGRVRPIPGTRADRVEEAMVWEAL
jgi:hypothetical protein